MPVSPSVCRCAAAAAPYLKVGSQHRRLALARPPPVRTVQSVSSVQSGVSVVTCRDVVVKQQRCQDTPQEQTTKTRASGRTAANTADLGEEKGWFKTTKPNGRQKACLELEDPHSVSQNQNKHYVGLHHGRNTKQLTTKNKQVSTKRGIMLHQQPYAKPCARTNNIL